MSSNIWLWLVMSFLPLLMAQSVRAQEQQNEPTVITTIKRLSEIERPATNVSELFSQSSTPSSEVVEVTAVKANQDQIALSENLKLLLGVRFDAFKQTDYDETV